MDLCAQLPTLSCSTEALYLGRDGSLLAETPRERRPSRRASLVLGENTRSVHSFSGVRSDGVRVLDTVSAVLRRMCPLGDWKVLGQRTKMLRHLKKRSSLRYRSENY